MGYPAWCVSPLGALASTPTDHIYTHWHMFNHLSIMPVPQWDKGSWRVEDVMPKFLWLQAWFIRGSQHFTFTTATIKLELSLLSLRVKWSLLVSVLSCQRFTRGATPVSAMYILVYVIFMFIFYTIYWLLDFSKSSLPTLFSFLLHTLWLAVQTIVPILTNLHMCYKKVVGEALGLW